jgi:activator of HSP90 ATPase
MALSFTVSDIIPASKEIIYNAWLDGKQHAAMTNTGLTQADTKVGDSFSAHDGYITGNNVELIPNFKIVQSWRSTEFSEDEADSLIEVTFEDNDNGTLVTLTHSNLPPHGMQYESGWKAYYFEPMREYFGG